MGILDWLTSSLDQIAAALEGFFWPKIFFDFLTKNLDSAVKPFPILQIINLVMGLWMVAWEYPLVFVGGTGLHRSLEARLAALPLFALAAILTYQGTNAGLYYLIAMVIYFWAYSEGEVCILRKLYLRNKANCKPDDLRKAMDSSSKRQS